MFDRAVQQGIGGCGCASTWVPGVRAATAAQCKHYLLLICTGIQATVKSCSCVLPCCRILPHCPWPAFSQRTHVARLGWPRLASITGEARVCIRLAVTRHMRHACHVPGCTSSWASLGYKVTGRHSTMTRALSPFVPLPTSRPYNSAVQALPPPPPLSLSSPHPSLTLDYTWSSLLAVAPTLDNGVVPPYRLAAILAKYEKILLDKELPADVPSTGGDTSWAD